jgi:hypothetical protein
MFCDVQRRDFLKRFVGFRKHSHIEPRIQRLLGFFPVAIRRELFRRDFDSHFIPTSNLARAGRIYLQIVEHDPLKQFGNELPIFSSSSTLSYLLAPPSRSSTATFTRE